VIPSGSNPAPLVSGISQTFDVAALLDSSSWSTYQKLLTVLAALAVIFDGFDIQILGFAIPYGQNTRAVGTRNFSIVYELLRATSSSCSRRKTPAGRYL